MTSSTSGDVAVMAANTALAELGRIMLGDQPLNRTLQRVAEVAQRALPEVDQVSVTLMDQDKPRTVVFTGSLAVTLDERQYTAGFGPCTDAALTGDTIVVDHHDPSNAYPDFSQAALRVGINHTVSVGLPVPRRIVGALNMYAGTPAPVADSTISLAQTFAGYAAVAVANAALYSSTADLARQMQTAVHSRTIIEQAKGILIARHGYSADAAFQTLVHDSQRRNLKLRDIAQAIVDGAVTA